MNRLACACLAACFLAGGAAQAALGQALSDPTRPPNVSSVSATEQGSVESDAPTTVLQSVLLSRGRKLALINGELVALGGRVGDATLANISETEVVLKYPDRVEVLKLLGGIERKPVRSTRAGAKVK